MKISQGKNHSVWKIDSDQYFPKVSEHILFIWDKKWAAVYFDIHNTT